VSDQLRGLTREYTLIFIDDGSNDGSAEVLVDLASRDPRTEVHRFRSNRGKAEALNVGFGVSSGEIIVTMDADLQDKPSELPKLLAALEDCDLVSGWKKARNDPLGKTMPSRLFNRVTAWVSGLDLHDFNCGFKAYRAEVVNELDLYGEMHRFIPVLAASRGFRVKEVAVEHAPRVWGKSKYGVTRLFKGAYDLLTVLLLTRFEYRPMHFFGTIGVVLGTIGFALLVYMSYLRLVLDQAIGTRPLFFLGVVLLLAGLQLVTAGLVGELVVRRTRGPGGRYVATRVGSEE
jgi:glycosyltransferase involved in cell wall biosynthesis